MTAEGFSLSHRMGEGRGEGSFGFCHTSSVTELSALKVCFLAGTLEHGGAERQLFYWLRTLRQCGARPCVFSLDQGEFWEDPIRKLGVRVVWVGQERARLRRLFRLAKEL